MNIDISDRTLQNKGQFTISAKNKHKNIILGMFLLPFERKIIFH